MNGPIDDTIAAPMIEAFKPCEAERALLWLLTRAKYDRQRKAITSQMSQKELARLAFGENETQAERALKRLQGLDLIQRIEKGRRGYASVYRVSAVLTPQNASIAPQGKPIAPQRGSHEQVRDQPSYPNISNQERSDSSGELRCAHEDRRPHQGKRDGSRLHTPW